MIRCPSCRSTSIVDRTLYCGDYHSQATAADWVERYQCVGCGQMFEVERGGRKSRDKLIQRGRDLMLKIVAGEQIGGFK